MDSIGLLRTLVAACVPARVLMPLPLLAAHAGEPCRDVVRSDENGGPPTARTPPAYAPR